MKELADRIRNAIIDVPDFPKPGIVFKDITPIMLDVELFSDIIDEFATEARSTNATVIAGIESRGFIFGAPLAQRMGLPFLLIRKPGKLPRTTHTVSYQLEYGEDEVQVHCEDCGQDDRVFIIDDLLATGGTAVAAAELIEKTGATVSGVAFLVELGFLNGAERLSQHDVYSMLRY